MSTGYLWLCTWNDAGYAGMSTPGQRSGRPPGVAEWDLVFLTYRLHPQATWTTAEGRELLQREFGREYSSDQGIRILRARVGLPFSKPLPRDDRRPPDAEDRRPASLPQGVTTLPEQGMGKDDSARGCLEEASPQNRANTVRVWSFEKSPVVEKNTPHCKSNTIGFYAIQGIGVQAFLADSKEDAMVDFLQPVKAAHAMAKAIVLHSAHPLSRIGI